MRTRRGLREVAVALAAVAVLGASIGCAPGDDRASGPTPSGSPTTEPIEVTEYASGEQDDPVEVDVDGGDSGVEVTFSEIRLAPGASTGEHCHHGQLVAVVQEGELTHYADAHPGGVRVYAAGESVIEGSGYVHEGRNEGDEDVVLWVTYIIPEGEPRAETDLSRCDP